MSTFKHVAQILLFLAAIAALGFVLRGCGTELPCDRATAVTVEQCGAVGDRR